MNVRLRWKQISASTKRRLARALNKNGLQLSSQRTREIGWIADLVDMGPAPKEDRQLANAIRARIELEKLDKSN